MALPVKVALDTNMLLSISELKVDIFRQIRDALGKVDFIVPIQVIEELSSLSKNRKTHSKGAVIAMELIEKNNVKQVVVEAKNADEALIKLSDKAVIASNDRELTRVVTKKQGHVIFLRQKKFAEVI
jgi:rRNA-processing protein FCF1